MRKTTIEGKNIEEVKSKAMAMFKEPEENLKFEITNEKKGFLGIGSLVTVSVSLNVNPAEEGLKYLNKVIENMDIDAKIEMITNDNEVKYNISSDNNPLLIGREGSTIDALQFVTRHVISRYTEERLVCLVDVGGYKQKRKMQLEILATKVAKDVARTRMEIKLDPMNSYERRVIHTKLSEWRDVYTESIGDEPNRCLIVRPKKR